MTEETPAVRANESFMPAPEDPFDRADIDLATLPYRDPAQEASNQRLLAGPDPVRVYVDDLRIPAQHPERWVVVRTAFEAIQILRDHDVQELSLDFDFGVGGLRESRVAEVTLALVGEGGDVARWLESELRASGRDRVPRELNIHSANSVGTKAIADAFRSISQVIALDEVRPGQTWTRR